MTLIRNGVQKWHSGSTVFLVTSGKIEVAAVRRVDLARARARLGVVPDRLLGHSLLLARLVLLYL